MIVFDFRLKLSVYNERSGRSAIIDAFSLGIGVTVSTGGSHELV